MSQDDDDNGFHSKPARYDIDGKEAIDILCERFSLHEMIIFCEITAQTYTLRAGRKGDRDVDLEKARWYKEFSNYLAGLGPDPRSYRRT